MTASLTSIRIIIPDDIGIGIIQQPDSLTEYRNYLAERYNLEPKSISNYDVENLRRAAVISLGQKALKEMGLDVPAEND